MSQDSLSDTERVVRDATQREWLIAQHVAAAREMNQSIDPCVELLDAAKAAVTGPRRAVYGPPELDQQATADLWSTWLNRRFVTQLKLTGHDVAIMMVLLKTARLANTPGHQDTLQDLAGYSAVGYRCHVVQRGPPA